MALKIKTDDFMIWLLMFMQLGFHTNTGYDDLLSLIVSLFILLYFVCISRKIGFVRLTDRSKEYMGWYTVVALVITLSGLWATHTNLLTILEFLADTYLHMIIALMCVSEYLKRGNNGIKLFTAFILAEIAVTIRALLNTDLIGLFSDFNTRLYGRGLGVNYNHFTTQLALVGCVVLFLAYYVNKMFYIPAVYILANIVISGSRKVIIVSVVAFLFLYLVSSIKGTIFSKVKRILIIGAILVAILFIITQNEFLNNLIGHKTMLAIREIFSANVDRTEDYSAYQRSVLIQEAIKVFKKHPVLGVGYYCYKYYNEWDLYAHNNYLELLADLGIVGFVAYYSFYVKSILDYFQSKIKFNGSFKLKIKIDLTNSKWNILGLTFMLTLLIMEYGHVTFFRPYVLLPIMVVTLGIENMKQNEKAMKEERNNVLHR